MNKGDRVKGTYMGHDFTGSIASIESDASGHPGTLNLGRIYIALDEDMIEGNWKRREKGDCIITLCEICRGRVDPDLSGCTSALEVVA